LFDTLRYILPKSNDYVVRTGTNVNDVILPVYVYGQFCRC